MVSFSDNYFLRYNAHPVLFGEQPLATTGMIVVIPCYDDAFVFDTLQSLEEANPSGYDVEVIVIVNSGENTPAAITEENRKITAELRKRSNENYYKRFRLLAANIENIAHKKAGVGYARKTGMDEAVRRFSQLNKPDGIIISLDADSLVDKNYFASIGNAFKNNPRKGAFTLQFQHDFNTEKYSEAEINACKLYETYLRYFRLSLLATGFPYSFHTIGSCFAFTAQAYIKAGGMPCKQGGEDFYFLHKLAPMTEVGEIKEILVYPSPRISDRVPFGTGPSVKNIINSSSYNVYNFELFSILKQFFNCFESFSTSEEIFLNNIPKEIIDFTGKEKFSATIQECKQNAKQGKNLTKRLFSKFDAFFIIKFLNSFDEKSNFPPIGIEEAAIQLLKHYKKEIKGTNIYDAILKLDVAT